MVAGVCGGIAEYFSIDPTLIRILAVVVALVGFGLPIILYIVGAVIIPRSPSEMSGIIDAEVDDSVTVPPVSAASASSACSFNAFS